MITELNFQLMTKSNGRGGARKNAGRKSQDKVRVTATIDRVLAEKLAKEYNKSATIEAALRAHYITCR